MTTSNEWCFDCGRAEASTTRHDDKVTFNATHKKRTFNGQKPNLARPSRSTTQAGYKPLLARALAALCEFLYRNTLQFYEAL